MCTLHVIMQHLMCALKLYVPIHDTHIQTLWHQGRCCFSLAVGLRGIRIFPVFAQRASSHHDWMIASIRGKCTSRRRCIQWDDWRWFHTKLEGRCFFFFKFEQLHVMTRLNLTTICCILRCLGFIPPSPNTPSHNVSVAYPRSESDLSRGLTSSSLPMLHTSTNFYENDDHHQL